MNQRKFNKAFSLTEVLIASGILVLGLMMILGTFPVGIKLTALSTERTIGAVAANEAFDKIQLYGLDSTDLLRSHMQGVNALPYNYETAEYLASQETINHLRNLGYTTQVLLSDYFTDNFPPDQVYPSSDYMDNEKYAWSILVRDIGNRQAQMTAFVCRKSSEALTYPDRRTSMFTGMWRIEDWIAGYSSPVPVPMPVVMYIDPELILPNGSIDVEQLIDDSLYEPAKLEQKPTDPKRVLKRYTDRIVISKSSFNGDDGQTNIPVVRNILADYFIPGAILLDDLTGQLMVVKERQYNAHPDYPGDKKKQKIILARQPDQLRINQNFRTIGEPRRDIPDVPGGLFEVFDETGRWLRLTRVVWVIPPAILNLSSEDGMPSTVMGRNPCVGVYQRLINY